MISAINLPPFLLINQNRWKYADEYGTSLSVLGTMHIEREMTKTLHEHHSSNNTENQSMTMPNSDSRPTCLQTQ